MGIDPSLSMRFTFHMPLPVPVSGFVPGGGPSLILVAAQSIFSILFISAVFLEIPGTPGGSNPQLQRIDPRGLQGVLDPLMIICTPGLTG